MWSIPVPYHESWFYQLYGTLADESCAELVGSRRLGAHHVRSDYDILVPLHLHATFVTELLLAKSDACCGIRCVSRNNRRLITTIANFSGSAYASVYSVATPDAWLNEEVRLRVLYEYGRAETLVHAADLRDLTKVKERLGVRAFYSALGISSTSGILAERGVPAVAGDDHWTVKAPLTVEEIRYVFS